ncbi:hypothetical protein BC940DRAFT_319210 [Gongronella butleri]|nr:hypothetical protein BC940DRAFT_319210 [Gongronella butleri]
MAAVCMLVLFSLAAMAMSVIGSVKRLRDVTTRMDHVLALNKELIHDFQIVAHSPNGWSVRIARTDIIIFAFRHNLITLNVQRCPSADSFDHFDEPFVLSTTLLLGLVLSARS